MVGWREWVSLPDLKIPLIKAKVDTGARTSSLHAENIEVYLLKGQKRVRFNVHPLRKQKNLAVKISAKVVDERFVTDSGGHREKRLVIETRLKLGELLVPIEITLSRRENMQFRMLLGRTALKGRALVNPGRSFLAGAQPATKSKRSS